MQNGTGSGGGGERRDDCGDAAAPKGESVRCQLGAARLAAAWARDRGNEVINERELQPGSRMATFHAWFPSSLPHVLLLY